MLNLPRHVKLYIGNEIHTLDEIKLVEECVYEFDCKNEREERDMLYHFCAAHPSIAKCKHRVEVEKLPVPEQDSKAIYQLLDECVGVTDGEGLIDNDECQFIRVWLKEHFNIVD